MKVVVRLGVAILLIIVIAAYGHSSYGGVDYDDDQFLSMPDVDDDGFLSVVGGLNGGPMGGLNGVPGRQIVPTDGTLVDKEQKRKHDEAVLNSYRLRLDTHTGCMPKKPTVIGGAPVLGPPRCIQSNHVDGSCTGWNYACTRFKNNDNSKCESFDMKKYIECWNWDRCGTERQCVLWNYQCLSSTNIEPNIQCLSWGMKYGVDNICKKKVKAFYEAHRRDCNCPEDTTSPLHNSTLARLKASERKIAQLKPPARQQARVSYNKPNSPLVMRPPIYPGHPK